MVNKRVQYGGYNYDSISIRRPFDDRSTAYQRSLSSQWQPASRSHADLFMYLGRSAAAHNR